MLLENKLGITNSVELALEEERISKTRAAEMFENGLLESLQPGSFEALRKIHEYLFSDIYDFAGQIRTVNLAKGNFRFAPVMYLRQAIQVGVGGSSSSSKGFFPWASRSAFTSSINSLA